MINPTIVINAYNRPASLERLLYSLSLARIPDNVNLVFSLEYNAHSEVIKLAKNYSWQSGSKEIIRHESKLGLIGHFMFCGGLSERYDRIIYLEDDLFVGPDFYRYAITVLEQYSDNKQVAGFSLNALWFNGYLHLPFKPIDDGNPCFFLQVPWYQGQVYTKEQWLHFKEWYEKYNGVGNDLLIHEKFRNYLLSDDWFPLKTQYLIESRKYYCFPRMSHCVNFGDAGTHFKKKTNFFQTELAIKFTEPRFIAFKDCIAIYDSFYELIPEKIKKISPWLNDYDITLDLNGTKDLSKVKSEYVISPIESKNYKRGFALEMRPPELNIVYEIPGDQLFLSETKSIKDKRNSKGTFYSQFLYYNRFKLSKSEKFHLFFNRW